MKDAKDAQVALKGTREMIAFPGKDVSIHLLPPFPHHAFVVLSALDIE
jgi:hypothetical protein